MKKFFLSVMVMLAAATMNINAMNDSFIFDYTPYELASKCNSNSDFAQEVHEELENLTSEVVQEYGSNSQMVQNLLTAVNNSRIADAANILQTLKQNETVESEDTDGFTDCKPLLFRFGLEDF